MGGLLFVGLRRAPRVDHLSHCRVLLRTRHALRLVDRLRGRRMVERRHFCGVLVDRRYLLDEVRRRDGRGLWLTRRLGSAFGVSPLLDVRNFLTSLFLAPHFGNGLVVDLDRLRDLPIRFFRIELEYLRDQVAFLLGGQVPAMDICGQDKTDRIVTRRLLRF